MIREIFGQSSRRIFGLHRRIKTEMVNEYWRRMPKEMFARSKIPHFLGPRGPLVEPSMSPVHPSATIFPEFIDEL